MKRKGSGPRPGKVEKPGQTQKKEDHQFASVKNALRPKSSHKGVGPKK